MANEASPLLDQEPHGRTSGYAAAESTKAVGTGAQAVVANGNAVESGEPELSRVQMAKIIFPLAIGIFLAAMDGTIVASSYASIGSELKQLQNTSWIATGYMLTLTSFQPLYGKLSDIFGRKACLLFAYSVFAVGCLFCGLAQDMNQLIAARALAGLGGGGMTTVVSILVSDVVPLRSRGTWQGVLNIIFATGSATGAPLGGLLADGIGWRWAFLIQVPATVMAIITVSLTLHVPTKHTSDLRSKLRRIDFTGAVLLVLAVFSLLLALDRGGNVAWSDRATLAPLGASGVLFALFGLVEARVAREPFAPRRIIAHRALLAAYLCNLFGFGASLCTVFNTSLYVQAVMGAPAAKAGLTLLPAVLGGVVGSLTAGLVMQKTGKFYWLTAGAYVMEFAGTIVVVLLSGIIVHSWAGVSIGLLILSLGNGSGVTSTLVALIANAAPEDQAIATAVSYLFRSLGSVIGISVGSTLVQNTLRSDLRRTLAGRGDVDVDELVARVRSSLASIDELDPATRAVVRSAYAQAVRAAFWFAVALAGAAAVSSFFITEKPLGYRPVGEREPEREEEQERER